MNDWELIQRYAGGRDDAAFEELVRRHAGFVLASARRQVGADLAEDVTQAVFLVLARKASTLGPGVVLSSWLFRATRFVVAQVRRQEGRRRRREQALAAIQDRMEAGAMFDSGDDLQRRLDVHLDEALAALPEAERRCILIRFFERQRFGPMAARLGLSEEAAKKRVQRALERMRLFLAGRGVAVSGLALGGLLGSPRAEAIPWGDGVKLANEVMRSVGGHGRSGPAALAREAISAWRGEAARTTALGWGPLGGLALVLVLAVSCWWAGYRPWGDGAPESTEDGLAPAGGAVGWVGRARPTGLGVRAVLDLRVVDEATGDPLPGVLIEERLRADGLAGATVVAANRVTDSRGAARLEWRGDEGAAYDLRLTHPGRVPAELSWRGYEFLAGPLDAECRLRVGRRIAGDVRDESGLPVGGARVRIQGDSGLPGGGRGAGSVRVEVVSQPDGSWWTDQAPSVFTPSPDERFGRTEPVRPVLFHVSHPEYAETCWQFDADAMLEERQTLVLRAGFGVVGRVMDPEGAGIAGAAVWEVPVPGLEEDLSRGTLTDTDGRFEIRHLRGGPQIAGITWPCLRVEASGFPRYEASFLEPDTENDSEIEFDAMGRLLVPSLIGTPRRPFPVHRFAWLESADGVRDTAAIEVVLGVGPRGAEPSPAMDAEPAVTRWVGRVVEAATGRPVARFSIRLAGGVGPDLFLGEGRDGAFDWGIGEAFEGGLSGLPEVSAEGYIPAGPRLRELREGVLHLEYRLETSDLLRGWVELPDGRPATGAWIGFGGRDRGLSLGEDGGWREGPEAVGRVRDGGRFDVAWHPGETSFQVVHAEGSGVFPCQPGTATVLRLDRWATLAGEVSEDGAPVPFAEVVLEAEGDRNGAQPTGIRFRYRTVADGEGRFVFRQVPPGRHEVRWVADAAGAVVREGVSVVRGTDVRVRLNRDAQRVP